MRQKLLSVLILSSLLSLLSVTSVEQAEFSLARHLFDHKRYQDAFQEFRDFTIRRPLSQNVNEAWYYTARSAFLMTNYYESAKAYQELSRRAASDTDRRRAEFGMAECAYRMKDYQAASRLFVSFAVSYLNSPARPAALHYARKSLQQTGRQADALFCAQTLISDYPETTYAQEAMAYREQTAAAQESKLRPVVVPTPPLAPGESVVQFGVTPSPSPQITVVYIPSPSPSPLYTPVVARAQKTPELLDDQNCEYILSDLPLKNPPPAVPPVIEVEKRVITVTNTVTNTLQITNREVIYPSRYAGDNQKLQEMQVTARKQAEENERYRALVELKARLLEMKEKAVKDKENLLVNPE